MKDVIAMENILGCSLRFVLEGNDDLRVIVYTYRSLCPFFTLKSNATNPMTIYVKLKFS